MVVIKTVQHFADSNLGAGYPQKRGVNSKKGGRVLEVVLPGSGTNDLPWERKGFPGGPGVGRNYTD